MQVSNFHAEIDCNFKMMDEYNSGMDPEIKRYFRKIFNSFTIGLIWLLSMASTGIFFGMGFLHGSLKWYNVLFYFLAVSSLLAMLRYFMIVWGKKKNE